MTKVSWAWDPPIIEGRIARLKDQLRRVEDPIFGQRLPKTAQLLRKNIAFWEQRLQDARHRQSQVHQERCTHCGATVQ